MREVIDSVERVTGRPVPWTLGAAAPGRSGGAVRRSRTRRRRNWAGRRALPDLDAIVRTAWRLAPASHPERLRGSLQRRDRQRPAAAALRLRAAVSRRGSGWAVVGMVVYAVGIGRPGCARSSRSSTTSCRKQQQLACIAWAIIGANVLKGVGSYVSSYLMADVGQRVVMDLRNALYPPHPRAVGRLLRAAHHRPADVAHQQRRRAGAAGGVGDGRRSRARVAGARRLRRRCCSTTTRGCAMCLLTSARRSSSIR